MFKINDCIMYGTVGACNVIDIKKETFLHSGEKEYYILQPIYSNNTVIKIPVDNDKISMRKILTKDEVKVLINSMPTCEIKWIEHERTRNEQFKAMLKTGSCSDLITLIKSIEKNTKNKKTANKSSAKADESIMQVAEKLLNEEFATVLNILPEEVPNYINEQLEAK